jgi:RNA polymerase sigma-70 factor (ECF subfamily)
VSSDPGFDELYELEFQPVLRAVFLLCGNAQLAEDATQEAFARALARWRRLRSHPVPGGWVTTTAMNVARRQLRKVDPRPVDDRLVEGPDAAEAIALRSAIRSLPARQQEAVALFYLLDLPITDVATAMDVDTGTVKTHLARARAALYRALQEPEPEPDPSEELTP